MTPERVSNNQLATVAKCDLATVLRYVHNRQGKAESAPAVMGSAIHECMKAFWGGATRKEAIAVLRTAYREWADEHIDPDDRFQMRLAWDNVRRSMLYYMRRNPPDSLPFVVNPERLEVSFEIDLTKSGDITLIGIIDSGPNRDRRSRKFYPVDHKSTSAIDAPWFLERFRMDSQITGYLWAVRQLTTEPVVGMYINAIQISKLPTLTQTKSGAFRKCREHGVPSDECHAQHQRSQLIFIDRNDEAIRAWRWDAIDLARRFLELREMYADLDDIEKVPQQGKFNGACGFCDFKEFCFIGRPVDRLNVMTAEREPRTEWAE